MNRRYSTGGCHRRSHASTPASTRQVSARVRPPMPNRRRHHVSRSVRSDACEIRTSASASPVGASSVTTDASVGCRAPPRNRGVSVTGSREVSNRASSASRASTVDARDSNCSAATAPTTRTVPSLVTRTGSTYTSRSPSAPGARTRVGPAVLPRVRDSLRSAGPGDGRAVGGRDGDRDVRAAAPRCLRDRVEEGALVPGRRIEGGDDRRLGPQLVDGPGQCLGVARETRPDVALDAEGRAGDIGPETPQNPGRAEQQDTGRSHESGRQHAGREAAGPGGRRCGRHAGGGRILLGLQTSPGPCWLPVRPLARRPPTRAAANRRRSL